MAKDFIGQRTNSVPGVQEFRTSMLHPPHEERLSRSAMAPVSGGQGAYMHSLAWRDDREPGSFLIERSLKYVLVSFFHTKYKSQIY